ncbi:hypothetical protein DM02DRAFT_660550 [Periconia macrospinosa]|uniref:Uncharacterized protein n=1 Tax=Periconia macrospinosa TaxID=97972 RepID=A0A2V1DAC9_9PLEO|nr:hypothetical protein DM02DRAFT_660550 [Periconia macrospinosa]
MSPMETFVRGHELNKYLQLLPVLGLPDHRPTNVDPFSYRLLETSVLRDGLTTAIRLLQIRLCVQGAFVLLNSDSTPYFLAGPPEPQSNEEDWLSVKSAEWLGATDADLQRWLWIFQQTTNFNTKSGDAIDPLFILPSMEDNDHSRTLSSVCGEPRLSFYAGTPIVSKQGTAIGTVFVVDNSTRNALSSKEEDILKTTARKCMAQLDFARESAVQNRWKMVNEQLSRFVGSRVTREQELEEPPPLVQEHQQRRNSKWVEDFHAIATEYGQALTKVEGAAMEGDDFSMGPESDRLLHVEKETTQYDGNKEENHEPQFSTSHSSSGTKRVEIGGKTTYRKIFRKAAECLQEALQADGVMFSDGLLGYHGDVQPVTEGAEELEDEISRLSTDKPKTKTEQSQSGVPNYQQSQSGDAQFTGSRVYTSPEFKRGLRVESPAEMLGLSTRNPPSAPKMEEKDRNDMRITELHIGQLPLMMDKYPKGVVWYIDDTTGKCFTVKDDLLEEDDSQESHNLISIFPGVLQLIFQPLTDPVSLKRMASCFVWSKQPYPVYSDTIELPALRGFLHTIEAEVSRNDAAAAAKQKELFVSSVSHELRTPLHGILGSVQLLADTPLDPFQTGLANTIKTSSLTLNETLASVLAYARINQFERQQHKHRERRSPDAEWALPNKLDFPPGPDTDFECLYKSTNLALLCEELAGVLEAGQSYGKPADQRKVAVAVEIDYKENWSYFTEPGALRRIALNIIGNALKYTTEGSVVIRLTSTDLALEGTELMDENTKRRITFTVKDTGIGMTKDFMENHLFIPFTQENTNANGVGLGMSIVKSLVSLLAGEIVVRSKPNEGTDITVIAPMRITNPEDGEWGKPTEEMAQITATLRREKLSVLLCGFPRAIRRAFEKHLREWFECKLLKDTEDAEPDVVMVEEGNETILSEVQKTSQKHGPRAVLLSIAMTPNQLGRSLLHPVKGYGVYERCSCPIGPHSLGKVLSVCVVKLRELRAQGNNRERSGSDDKHTFQEEKEYKWQGNLELSEVDVSIPSSIPTEVSIEGGAGLYRMPSLERKKVTDTITDTPYRSQSISEESSGVSRSNLDVLVVEDNAINRRLLGTFLDKHGCRNVQYAENGALAVEAVEKRERNFNVIFMDLSMPVMDGFTATRNIRRIERERERSSSSIQSTSNPTSNHTYIIALTGLASDRDEDAAHVAGVNQFITKPVKFNQLTVQLKEQEEILSSKEEQ